MNRLCFFLLATMCASSGMSYRFVCNGILANGEQRSDECGICTVETAARWENSTIAVVVDDQPLPKTISLTEWQSAIKASFSAWEGVPGANIKFMQMDRKNLREFGANEDMHEIFWVTDRAEWRKLVGNGEFGTLGATLPKYVCGDDSNKRVILDADLVLNGMPHINWQMDCRDEDCIFVQTTLVHELGHFFGLDHPCLMCSSSIMSARAGFDLTTPVFDDMEGLRALYPDARGRGEFGYPCTNDSDCQNQNHCIVDGKNSYCSKSCRDDGECGIGSICRDIGAFRVCAFVDDENAGGRTLGENCMRAPCVDDLVCAGASEPNFYCFLPCKNKSTCKQNEDCIDLEDDLSICVGIKNKGEQCGHRELCDDSLYCVFDTRNEGYCRAPCQTSGMAITGCGEGEQCQLLDGRALICMPSDQNLVLDEHLNEFGNNATAGSGQNEPSSSPAKQEIGGGCHNMGSSSFSNFPWLLILVGSLFFAHRKRRQRNPDLAANDT